MTVAVGWKLTNDTEVADSLQDTSVTFDKVTFTTSNATTSADGMMSSTDKTKLDIKQTKVRLKQWLVEGEGFGFASGEWQYAYTKPRILAEKYLSNLGESSLVDYKFNCFKGCVHSCLIAYNRSIDDPHGEVCFDLYDKDWNQTEGINPIWHKNRKVYPKPKTYERMVEIASKLSEDFDYVRVDLYEIEDHVLFGELTFSPHGYVPEYYEQWMLDELGEQLVLS